MSDQPLVRGNYEAMRLTSKDEANKAYMDPLSEGVLGTAAPKSVAPPEHARIRIVALFGFLKNCEELVPACISVFVSVRFSGQGISLCAWPIHY